MRKREISLTSGQAGELAAPVLEALLSVRPERAQYWIGRKRKLTDALLKVLNGAVAAPAGILADWQAFWQKLGIEADFSDLHVPEGPGGFERVLAIPEGLTINRAFQLCGDRFPSWSYHNDLDSHVTENERSPSGVSYAIRCRNRVEADEEMAGKSADDIHAEGTTTLTLLERMVYELKFHDETGGHLDLVNWTLCAGSRDRRGGVPSVGWWAGSGLCVCWDDSDGRRDGLRARVAVS